tara:strand:- start:75 stop:770 length:696 start_codon:yes stop_codon:yes gene_type:complete
MKYFLVLGIEYKKFKNPADITIHVGDKFIDTFQLDRDYTCTSDILPHIESKWFEKLGIAKWHTYFKYGEIPTFFKVYEIDDSVIEGKLDIKVENANSDFTNGFMKNSSLIRFPIASLFKKDLVENRGEKMMKTFKNGAIGKIVTEETCHWPNAYSFNVSKENEIYEKSSVKNFRWPIGGNFTAEFMIKTKHCTKYLAPANDEKFVGLTGPFAPRDYILASCKQLLNIYDED